MIIFPRQFAVASKIQVHEARAVLRVLANSRLCKLGKAVYHRCDNYTEMVDLLTDGRVICDPWTCPRCGEEVEECDPAHVRLDTVAVFPEPDPEPVALGEGFVEAARA